MLSDLVISATEISPAAASIGANTLLVIGVGARRLAKVLATDIDSGELPR